MLKLAPPVQEAYERALQDAGDSDPYAGSGFLGIRDVLKAHFLIADFFYHEGSGLGGMGPIRMDMLHSTLHRQHVSYRGHDKWEGKYHICATLFFGLIKDHVFHDANKRTALLSLLYHLQTINYCLTLTRKEVEDFSVVVAENGLGRYRRYKAYESNHSKDDATVRFIADHIRKNSRRIDKSDRSITFNDLRRILNRFGYDLKNPKKNYIDLVRIQERRKVFGIFGEKQEIGKKIAHIGFPNWTAQVGRGVVADIRKKTELTPEKGVDSQSFYKNHDPISILISRYQEPLRRLADR